MSTLGDKLKTAGVNVDSARLYVVATEAYAAANGDIRAGAVLAVKRGARDIPIIVAAMEYYMTTVVARDVRGLSKEPVRAVVASVPKGQKNFAAPHGPVEGDGGQPIRAPALSDLPLSPSPVETDGATSSAPPGHIRPAPSVSPSDVAGATFREPTGRGHPAPATSSLDASGASPFAPIGPAKLASDASPSHDGAGHARYANGQAVVARPVVNPPRGMAAIAAVNKSLSQYDTFKVRGGIAIGDLTIGEARTIAATNEREASILRELIGKVQNAPAGATLRQIIKPKELETAIARNAEFSYA